MKMNLIFLALGLSFTVAHASEFDARAKIAADRENRNQIAKMKANAAVIEKKDLIDIENFGKKNSGYAKKPECFAAWTSDGRTKTKQVCNQSLCVNVRTNRYSMPKGDNFYEWDLYFRYQNISSCEVLLKNGLACRISTIYNDGKYDRFGGTCLDSRGNSKELSVPSVWAR